MTSPERRMSHSYGGFFLTDSLESLGVSLEFREKLRRSRIISENFGLS